MIVVDDILKNQFQDLEQSELVSLIGIIHTQMMMGNYWVLDNLFRDLSPNASSIVIVSTLRASFSARSYLPNWQVYLHRVKKSLSDRGEDPKDLLQGLIPQDKP